MEVRPKDSSAILSYLYHLDDKFNMPDNAKRPWDYIALEFLGNELQLVKSDSGTNTPNPDWSDEFLLKAVKKGEDHFRVHNRDSETGRIILRHVFGKDLTTAKTNEFSIDDVVRKELGG